MVDTNKENKSWHQEHALWVDEVKQWQHDTDRLVALLYQLERSLPEHTSMLAKHISLIEQHEELVSNYDCGRAAECQLHSCSELKSPQQQVECHQRLSRLHDEARQEHLAIKKIYSEEREKFKLLLNKLLNEC